MENNSKVFEIPKGLPPIRDYDHVIQLFLGSVPPNIGPCKYPYAQKSKIKCMIAEMLEVGIILPKQSYFFGPVILVHKKDVS